MHVYTHTYVHTYVHTLIHTYTYAHTNTHTHTQTHTHTRTRTHTQEYIHIHTHTHAYIQTGSRTLPTSGTSCAHRTVRQADCSICTRSSTGNPAAPSPQKHLRRPPASESRAAFQRRGRLMCECVYLLCIYVCKPFLESSAGWQT